MVAKAENWSKANSFRARADFEKVSPFASISHSLKDRGLDCLSIRSAATTCRQRVPPMRRPTSSLEQQALRMMWHSIRTRLQMGVPYLLLLRNVLRDPSSGLEDILTPGLFLQLCRFLHQLAGAVCERFSPFAFLA